MFASAEATNGRNQGLARLLGTLGRLGCEPAEAVAVYTRQSCLAVTAADLAAMGATLATAASTPARASASSTPTAATPRWP